eukprot:CAMPEP_0206148702 /NCGR_PEP_ID=MMETSP1473-20131121/37391_1 /ASSEMBLY_ACC=CAM_ASM_001109 /TAXON_ID=1461547 /ORGANISM="Stichococcus sp, Strain RCC1054" /LENGTH=121 /DNA_ID=CAMNT_0053546123 /DNA_START=1019 /DNA_END=1384 /DNA_ORIENTATION=+
MRLPIVSKQEKSPSSTRPSTTSTRNRWPNNSAAACAAGGICACSCEACMGVPSRLSAAVLSSRPADPLSETPFRSVSRNAVRGSSAVLPWPTAAAIDAAVAADCLTTSGPSRTAAAAMQRT